MALALAWLVASGTSVLADGPPIQLEKRDSGVSPLLRQFIEERNGVESQQGPDQPGDAVPRSDYPALTTKDEAGIRSPSSDETDDPVRFDPSGNVQVYINLTDTNHGTLQQLRDLGADIEIVNSDWKKLQAWVPVEALDQTDWML